MQKVRSWGRMCAFLLLLLRGRIFTLFLRTQCGCRNISCAFASQPGKGTGGGLCVCVFAIRHSCVCVCACVSKTNEVADRGVFVPFQFSINQRLCFYNITSGMFCFSSGQAWIVGVEPREDGVVFAQAECQGAHPLGGAGPW